MKLSLLIQGGLSVVRVLCLSLVDILFLTGPSLAQPALEPSTRLLIAFASTRERWDPPYPKIYFYEHDGIQSGKLLESIDTISKGINNSRSDMHPALSRDGRYC